MTRTYHVGDVDVHALRGVSLIVEPGEFIAIMGSSGSGKSTLMSLLGCLDRPSSGEYYLEGVNVARLTEPELARIRSERLGFVFQSFNLLARTSAIENVALPLFYAAAGTSSRTERTERARAALKLLGLADRERNTPGQLSGGQQQRVAIARALINNPILLLADEPTGNLDTRNSHEIMETLQSLNRERGVTIIVVTHEPDIATYTDRVITMRDGEVISDERKPAVRRQPEASTGELPAGLPPGPRQPAAVSRASAGTVRAFAVMIVAAALQALARNKMRSALTMLGVFIGVAALIAMVAVGQGANEAVRKQIESLGTNLLVVVPGATTMGGMRSGQGSASTLTVVDADGAPPGGSGGRQRQLPDPPVRTGPIRQSELDHEHSGRQRQLSADHQLADHGRARNFTGGRQQRGSRRGAGPDGCAPIVRHRRESDRRRDPGQEHAVARDRRSRFQRDRPPTGPIRTISS